MANVDRDRGSFSDAGTKAGLAATIVTKLTPSQLGALEPQTAVALMLALHRTALAEHSTPLASLESDRGPSPIFSGASAERRDFQYWNVRFTTKPEGDEAVAAKRLQLYGPRAVTYTADGDQLSEIRYTPPGR